VVMSLRCGLADLLFLEEWVKLPFLYALQPANKTFNRGGGYLEVGKPPFSPPTNILSLPLNCILTKVWQVMMDEVLPDRLHEPY